MAHLSSVFLLILSMCLTACSIDASLKTEDVKGLWMDEKGLFFYLDEDGALGLPEQSDKTGINWHFDGSMLTLSTVDASDLTTKEQKLIFQKKSLFGAEFLDEEGRITKWSRKNKKVGKLSGTLFYRERMMLPPDVTISVQLRPMDSDNVVAQSIMPADGRGTLSFLLYYLESQVKDKARLSASVSFDDELLFATKEDSLVSLETQASVLLHHTVLSRELPSLKETHWHLKELDGIPASHFSGQPEAHLILQGKGQAAGSDGCNNFFMSWEADEKNISFSLGGATLRICPHGDEQARAMYKMFTDVDSWKIEGSELKLYSKEKEAAVFEALDM